MQGVYFECRLKADEIPFPKILSWNMFHRKWPSIRWWFMVSSHSSVIISLINPGTYLSIIIISIILFRRRGLAHISLLSMTWV